MNKALSRSQRDFGICRCRRWRGCRNSSRSS
jgi:hypothetical protein